MKRYAKQAAVLAAAVMTAASVWAAEEVGLKDIDGHWAQASIQNFYENHYINGSGGYFKPDDPLTREGAAAIINNMVGSKSGAASHFTDMKGRWSEEAVATLAEKHIINGYDDNTFRPTEQLDRETFAVIAYNYLTYKGNVNTAVTASPFADESDISPWAEKAVGVLASAGYIKGNSDNEFKPKELITRAQAVEILYRIQNGVKSMVENRSEIQQAAFAEISGVYGSIKDFAKDGVMYWQGGKLHIASKDDKKRQKLMDAIDTSSNTALRETVIVQRAKYGQKDYETMMKEIEEAYRRQEPASSFTRMDSDYVNEKVILVVKRIDKSTQEYLELKYGDVLRTVIA